MDGTIVLVFPAPPSVFGLFLGVLTAYMTYAVIKFVRTLITGG